MPPLLLILSASVSFICNMSLDLLSPLQCVWELFQNVTPMQFMREKIHRLRYAVNLYMKFWPGFLWQSAWWALFQLCRKSGHNVTQEKRRSDMLPACIVQTNFPVPFDATMGALPAASLETIINCTCSNQNFLHGPLQDHTTVLFWDPRQSNSKKFPFFPLPNRFPADRLIG